MWKWWQFGAAASLCGLLAACGGGGSGSNSAVEPPAQVVIEQKGLLLPGQGHSAQLQARALDANGHTLSDAPSWTSSRPEVVQVDKDGRVTAAAASGSAQVVAHVGAIISAPLIVVVAEPAAGVRMLSDEQIVGDPVETDPAATAGPGSTYRIVLASGVELPEVGQQMLGSGSKSLAGEVTQVDGTTRAVTLRPVAPRLLLPNLRINEVIDLAQAEIATPPDIAAAYEVKRNGTTLEYTPRRVVGQAVGRDRIQRAVGTRALPPYTECESDVPEIGEDATPPVTLSVPPLFSLTLPSQIEYVDTPERGVERLILRGETSAKVEYGVKVVVAFEGKVGCKAELGTLTVPIGGFLAWVAGAQIPYGIGWELGGKLTVADFGIGGKAEVTGPVEVGFACDALQGCAFVREFNLTPKNEWTTNGPSPADLRLDVGLSAYGYADFNLGSRIFSALQVKGFTAKFGAKLAGSFAPQATQVLDRQYKSDYKVSLEASAGIGQDLDGILRVLGVESLTALDLNLSRDIANSPTGTVSADRARFVTGDRVNFRVTLDRTDFFAGAGPYNVKKVLLVHDSAGTLQVVGTRQAVPGDTTFDFEFDATGPGSASDFHAFVVTWLMPFDYAALEIGQATGTDVDLAVTSTSLPSGVVGGIYAAAVSAEGGQPAYHWSATGLPGGLSIDSASGAIHGTPGSAGTFQVRVSVIDRQGNLAERTLPLTVVQPDGPWVGTWLVTVSVTSSRSISAPGFARTTDINGTYAIQLEADANGTERYTVMSTSGSGAQVTHSGGSRRNEKSCGAPDKNVYARLQGSSILVGGQVSIETAFETSQGFNCLNFNSPRGRIVSAQFGGGASLVPGSPGAGPRTTNQTIDRSNPAAGIVDIETLTVTVSL